MFVNRDYPGAPTNSARTRKLTDGSLSMTMVERLLALAEELAEKSRSESHAQTARD